MKTALSDKGIIFVQVPYMLGVKLQRRSWALPHHIWHFSPGTIKKVVELAGYEVLDWYTGTSGIIGVYESGRPSVLTKTIWKVNERLKIGSRMQVVLRKQEWAIKTK